MPSRSQRHKVIWQGVASNGEQRANDAYPNNEYPGAPFVLVPTVSQLNPNTIAIGTPATTLRVIGTNFDRSSKIVWNNGDEPTTYVSPTELTTGVDPSSASGAYTVPVGVRNGLAYSNTLTFSVTGAVPPLTAINPDTATLAAAGPTGRTVVALSGVGGTPPLDFTIGFVSGLNITKQAPNLIITTADPFAVAGTYNIPIVGTDSKGQTLTEDVVLTVT